jgi:hypothetical protein
MDMGGSAVRGRRPRQRGWCGAVHHAVNHSVMAEAATLHDPDGRLGREHFSLGAGLAKPTGLPPN